MSNLYQNPRSRNLFVSNAGDDNYSGFSDDFPKRELSAAITAASALSPTIGEPVAIVESGATRYLGDFIIPDFVRVFMTLSSINNGSIKLPDTSNVTLASILTPFDPSGASPATAVDTNDKSRASLTCLGVVLLGKGDTGYYVSGVSSENFCEIGQVSCIQDDCTLIKFDTSGIPRQLDFKEANIGSTVPSFGPNDPNNCIGVEYNAASSESLTLNIGSLTNDKAGTGNLGIWMRGGHMHFNGSEIMFDSQDAILVDGGELDIDSSDVTGNTTINAGSLTVDTQRYQGDLQQNAGNNYFHSQVHTGDITIDAGTFNFLGQDIIGEIVVNGGIAQFNFQLHNGSFTANSGVTTIDCNGEIGSFTVNVGAIVYADVFLVTGTITNAGGLNGVINGIKYGSYIDGTELTLTFLRDGTIPTSWETFGRVTIDTTNDTLNDVVGKYTQTAGGVRQVNFRLRDEDALVDYYTGTITDSGVGEKMVALSSVLDLPANQAVNLIFQAERSGGGGVSASGGQIDLTRV